MESPVLATILTTYSLKPNATNKTQALCELPANSVFIFAYSLVFLISLLLNGITMRAYFCTDQHVKSSITVYMKNLVAADFFLCLCLLLRIASYANNSEIIINIYCSFGATAFYLNMYASILFMDFVALNRYLKIAQPLETHTLQTVRTARCISAATWLSLLAATSIYLITVLQSSWGKNLDKFSCESQHSSQYNVTYKFFQCLTVAGFIFVLVSLILLYWKTLQKLRQVRSSTRNRFSSRIVQKSKRNMLVLVVIFCVCFVPYHLVKLPYVFLNPLLKDCTSSHALYILKEVTILLTALNASLDPLIYFIFCKSFRSQFNFRCFLL